MKKVFYAFVLLAAVAAAFSSCKKDDNKDDNKIVKRLTQCGDQWDVYVFSYDSDGKIAKVNRNEGEKVWTFNWTENKADYAEKKKDGTMENLDPWTFTLTSDGYLAEFSNNWGDTWKMTYSDGYLTKIERKDKGTVVANCTWVDGDLRKWSRFESETEQWKIQTFLTDENVGGIFPDATDKAGVGRWMFELGLMGKPSKHLLDVAGWEGSTSSAVQTYEKDADGYVTKVNKVYGTDEPEVYEYAWEVVK